MKLFHTLSSPSSRSVLMTIRCLNLDVEIQQIDLLKGENRSPEFLKINPSGQVPTLVDGDLVLSESRAILAYLINSKDPGNSLYPSDVRKRAICDSRLYFDATGFFVHLLAALAPVFFKGAKDISSEVREKLMKALEHIEKFLEGNLYIAGNEPTIADITLLSNIIQLQYAFGGFENLPSMPNINAWFERCSALSGYEENLSAGALIGEILTKMDVKIAPLK